MKVIREHEVKISVLYWLMSDRVELGYLMNNRGRVCPFLYGFHTSLGIINNEIY